MRQIFFVDVQLVGEFGLRHVPQASETRNTHPDTAHLLMKIFFHTLHSQNSFEKYSIKKSFFVDARKNIVFRLTGIAQKNLAAYVFIVESLTGYNELNIIYRVKRFIV